MNLVIHKTRPFTMAAVLVLVALAAAVGSPQGAAAAPELRQNSSHATSMHGLLHTPDLGSGRTPSTGIDGTVKTPNLSGGSTGSTHLLGGEAS